MRCRQKIADPSVFSRCCTGSFFILAGKTDAIAVAASENVL